MLLLLFIRYMFRVGHMFGVHFTFFFFFILHVKTHALPVRMPVNR